MVTSASRDFPELADSIGLSESAVRHTLTWDPASTTFNDPKRVSVPNPDMNIVIHGIADSRPRWVAPVVDSVAQLLELPTNWDSYGAAEVDPGKIIFGLTLLLQTLDPRSPAPTVVPTPSGGVQFEWHRQGIDVEIEVVATGKVNLYYENAATGDSEESTLASDFGRLVTVLRELAPDAGG